MAPRFPLPKLAAADEIWITEGIFDAIALSDTGLTAVSAMSCYNYPEKALGDLRKAIAEGDTPTRRPKLIWAFDIGKAGTEYMDAYRRDHWLVCVMTALSRLQNMPDWPARMTADVAAMYMGISVPTFRARYGATGVKEGGNVLWARRQLDRIVDAQFALPQAHGSAVDLEPDTWADLC